MIRKVNMLSTLADKIREVYCEERNRWNHLNGKSVTWGDRPIPRYDGGIDSMGRKYGNVWLEIAKFVTANKMNYAAFVRAQFSIARQRPIDPTQLNKPKARDLYLSVAQRSSSDTTRLFLLQKNVFSRETAKMQFRKEKYHWTDAQIFRAVLGNRLLSLSALFRYCLARSEGYSELAESFHQEAIEQYLDDPDAYDRIWEQWVPDDFRRDVRKLIETVDDQESVLEDGPSSRVNHRVILID